MSLDSSSCEYQSQELILCFTTGHFLEVFLNCYSLRDTTYF
jgi:hypothetical protein